MLMLLLYSRSESLWWVPNVWRLFRISSSCSSCIINKLLFNINIIIIILANVVLVLNKSHKKLFYVTSLARTCD